MISASPNANSSANTATDKKSKVWTSTDDSSCIPLPIQSFLWRQTNPFFASKVGKLHEASCVTFERVIVQNILHGLSPSLSDAIQSIPRWRLVRATFPHVAHCLAALLAEREKEEESGGGGGSGAKMSQSLVKMMYILHWMVLDSASECMDSDCKGRVTNEEALNQYTFPLNCIQLFVYLFAPLIHVIKETDIVGSIRLENGLALWRALWDNRQPDIFCFSAFVKPKKSQLLYVPFLRRSLQQTTAAQDIYMGESSVAPGTDQITVIDGTSTAAFLGTDISPIPPSASRSSFSGYTPSATVSQITEIRTRLMSEFSPKKKPVAESISPVSQQSPPKVVSTQSPTKDEQLAPIGLGISGSQVVRSVSDYRKLSAAASSVQQQQQDQFSLETAGERFKFVEEGSSAGVVNFWDPAPLVQLNDICGGSAWTSLDLPSSGSTQCEVVCEVCRSVLYRDGAFVGTCHCDGASQVLKVTSSGRGENYQTVVEVSTTASTALVTAQGIVASPESPSVLTEIRTVVPFPSSQPLPTISLEKRASLVGLLSPTAGQSQQPSSTWCDCAQASYMDVAVLRCLFIRHWSEEGVAWALRYIYQRLLDIASDLAQKKAFRKRSRSVPAPSIKITFAGSSAAQSATKTDLDLDLTDPKRRFFPWQDLKFSSAAAESKEKNGRSATTSKGKVAFFVSEGQPLDKRGGSFRVEETPSQSNVSFDRRRSFTNFKQMFGGKVDKKLSSPEDQSDPINFPFSRLDQQTGSKSEIFSDSVSSLARSYTDSNISYLTEYLPEAVGSAPFIFRNGNLNLSVMTEAVASITERKLSLRVCESILSVFDVVIDLDMSHKSAVRGSTGEPDSCLVDKTSVTSSTTTSAARRLDAGRILTTVAKSTDKVDNSDVTVLSLMVKATIRIYLFLGCPFGCNEGIRGPQADFLRTQARSLLSNIQRIQSTHFNQSFVKFVEKCELNCLLDFFHAFTGFCSSDGGGTQARVRSVSRASQDDRTTKSGGGQQVPTYKNKFFAAQKGVEGVIVMTTFKKIISRLMNSQNELRQPENMGLYSDVRSLMNFVQENHGHPFRLVELSALSDAMHPLIVDEVKTEIERSSGSAGDSDSEKGSRGISPETAKSETSTKKSFFSRTKPKEKYPTEDSDHDSSSPGTPRHRLSTEDTPITSSSSPLLPGSVAGKKKASRLQMALNILKSVRSDGHGPIEEVEVASESDLEKSQEDLSTSEQTDGSGKRTRRISFKSAARSLRLLTKVRKRHTTENSEDISESRKDKLTIDQLLIPVRTLVNIAAVREGARRFAFMLETCKPGTVPDAPLLAVLLDLKAPVISRAMIFLECAHFVHRCNKGLWPDWLRMNMLHARVSSVAPLGRGTPSGLRRANLMLRTAGKMFYLWAEAVGSRLEEILQKERVNAENMVKLPADELSKKQLRVSDDLEDFLDEAVVNSSGEECPYALKFLACMLIFEVTSFLRDTFQNLPRSRSHSRAQPVVEKLMSHRRWSVLSNTFNPSQSGSIQSIADFAAILHREPPNITSSDQRRISFCAPEEEESLHSSHSTLDETAGIGEKRTRRLAQGRTRLLKRGALSASQRGKRSFRQKKTHLKEDEESDMGVRDSFKLRKASTISAETSCEMETINEQRVFPTDYRRVSAESRADEACATSLVSDQEEIFLSKNMPWLKTVVHLSNMFNFVCSHQKYCHPFCFQRTYRQCHRLAVALRKVYGEEFPLEGQLDRRKTLLENMIEKSRDRSVDRRKQSSVTTSRRESALVRGAFDKGSTLHLKTLLTEKLENDEMKDLKSSKKHPHESEKVPETKRTLDESPVLKYLKFQVQNPCHSSLSAFLKSALIASDSYFQDMLPVAWELLLEPDSHLVAAAAATFIVSSVKHPELAVDLIKRQMQAKDPIIRSCAVYRFHVLWRNRYHCWLKMEEGAQLVFKVPPPGIDFTLPSPPIGQSQAAVVDPPWMPHIKTKVQELSLKEEEDSTSQTIMTMTKTRRKHKQEILKRALEQAEERKSLERQQFFFLATPVQLQAAYEPALFQTAAAAVDEEDAESHPVKQQVPVAQPLFPSWLCSVVPLMIQMLDDSEVNHDGVAVNEVVRKVIWSCIVEDCALFIRFFLEKLTTKDKQEELTSLLRKVIQLGPLPAQTAYTLLNYLIGFIMYYVRAPCDGSQDAVGMALSLIWMILPSVQGLYFKDVKQTLKKEQCDAALLITANVPMAKKIIIQGPETGSIPSQFNILEDTQFSQILIDCADYFGISEDQIDTYFLIDAKTGFMHNPNSYVRDFYFFRRSFYPQLNFVQLNVEEANARMKQMAFSVKFAELGRVLLSYSVLRSSPDSIVPQRIYFLHEELTRLPAFPRKALEACFGMYNKNWGKELYGADMLHKLSWIQLVTTMLRSMENPYLFGDLHLFINVINGVLILHCEDSSLLRHCMATYIELSFHFKAVFSTNGFFLIMPTIVRCYSQHQVNFMLCEVIEFSCKQFYVLHRKPFLLQMFGSIATMLDFNDDELEFDSTKIKASHLFKLLSAMEKLDNQKDSLEILSIVRADKPLKSVDMCYKDDPDTFCILTDAIASCVTICAYAPDSKRCYQMLMIMQAILPHYMRQIQDESKKGLSTPAILKHELHVLTTLTIQIKVLINCCDVLSRHFSGPQRTIEIGSNTGRGRSVPCDSPQQFERDEPTATVPNKVDSKKSGTPNWEVNESMEIQRELFRRPRDSLLTLSAVFFKMTIARIKELSKAVSEHGKTPDLIDQKSYIKLSEVAHSLLKLAPYDPNTLSCEGLQRYFMDILPLTDWSVEHNRSALNFILRRVDKTFGKVVKKSGMRRRVNWDALSNWLRGLHSTLNSFPYLAHLHFFKTCIQISLKILIGDPIALGGGDESSNSVAHSAPATVLSSFAPPLCFSSIVIKLTCLLMQALGEHSFSLEYICSVENLGTLNERIEAVLCHIIIPIFLRAGIAAKDSPQLRHRDLTFCLNLMLNSINPSLTKATLGPTSSLTATIAPRTSESLRQGSVSAAERATVGVPLLSSKTIRESIYQTVFLALKAFCLSFEKKLGPEWVRIVRLIKELGTKRAGGAAYWSFLDFALTSCTPLRVLLLPFLEHKLLLTKPQSDQESQWFEFMRDRLFATQTFASRCNGICLLDLAAELGNLKEDLSTRSLENHSRTPTILADLHSDSSSVQSVSRRQSDIRRTSSDVRRLSFSSKVTRLSPSPIGKPGSSPQESLQSPIDECTIMEEAETDSPVNVHTTESLLDQSHLVRHKATLRLHRGSHRKSRRSFYKPRDHTGAHSSESMGEAMELSSFSRTATTGPRRTRPVQKTQSLDYPVIYIGSSTVPEHFDWTDVPSGSSAIGRDRSRSHSPGDETTSDTTPLSLIEQLATSTSGDITIGTSEKVKLL